MVIAIILVLSILGGTAAVASPTIRSALTAYIDGAIDFAAIAAGTIFRWFRRILTISFLATFIYIIASENVGLWPALVTGFLLMTVIVLLTGSFRNEYGAIDLAGMGWRYGVTLLAVIIGTMTSSLWIINLFGLVGALGFIALSIIAFAGARGMIAFPQQTNLLARLFLAGEVIFWAAATVFAGLAMAVLVMMLVHQAEYITGTHLTVLPMIGLLILGGLLAFVASRFHSRWARYISWLGYAAIIVALVFPFVPMSWRSAVHYSAKRAESKQDAAVQKLAVTGRIYYILRDTVEAYRCDSCQAAAGDTINHANLKDSVVIGKRNRLVVTELVPGRFVSMAPKPVEIDGVLFVAVHPSKGKNELGYNTQLTYLVNKEYLYDTSVDQAGPQVRYASYRSEPIGTAGSITLTIPNGRGWVPTGIMVQKDDVVRCEISGRVPFTTMRVEPPSYKGDTTTGPMGTGLRPAQLREPIKVDEQFLDNNEPIGTALFRVGEETRSYASEGTGEMKFKEDGQVYVGVNTRVGLSYNTGEFIGTCKVYRRS